MLKTWVREPHLKGDWLNDSIITFPFDITTARIDFHFKQGAGSNVSFKWNTEDDTIEKLTAFKIKLKGFNLNAKAGNYIGDLQITFSNGENVTYFKSSLQIVQDITEIVI